MIDVLPRHKNELEDFLEFLKHNRKNYLKRRGSTEYSRKIYHYIRILKFVLHPEELGIDELGILKSFSLKNRKKPYKRR